MYVGFEGDEESALLGSPLKSTRGVGERDWNSRKPPLPFPILLTTSVRPSVHPRRFSATLYRAIHVDGGGYRGLGDALQFFQPFQRDASPDTLCQQRSARRLHNAATLIKINYEPPPPPTPSVSHFYQRQRSTGTSGVRYIGVKAPSPPRVDSRRHILYPLFFRRFLSLHAHLAIFSFFFFTYFLSHALQPGVQSPAPAILFSYPCGFARSAVDSFFSALFFFCFFLI